nr:reverse transcriptase domain-containing protein [Tanacetum cinerariifolium]
TREALARSEAYCRALEARFAVLETHARRLEWQHQAADDFTVQHIMRTQALEAGARDDTLEDTDATLTWWNSQIRTLGPDAYTMTWSVLKKKMTDKYCPLGEVKKLEIELWNLKVKDNNILAYTNRFQELALICTKFRDCRKLNNKNEGNGNAQGWVYAVGNGERNGNAAGNPDSNVVTERC